ncbi:hypothetical protein P5V15_015248 [Pogonomyrmex californicus]
MRTLTYRNRPVFKTHTPSPRCEKCGKIGHYGHECRTSRFSNRYTLPKPERQPRINTIEKQCSYCKKIGHLRHECWTLNGKPGNSKNSGKIFSNSRRENSAKNFKDKKSETGEDKSTVPRPASEYRVAHVKGTLLVNTGLNAITLPIAEAKGRKINFLFDTGASATIIKLKHVLNHVLIYEEKIKLTGITGHEIVGWLSGGDVWCGLLIGVWRVCVRDDPCVHHRCGCASAVALTQQSAVCFQCAQSGMGDRKRKVFVLDPRIRQTLKVHFYILKKKIHRAATRVLRA